MSPGAAELSAWERFADEGLAGFDRLDELAGAESRTAYPDRRVEGRPGDGEDPYNAVVTRCTVRGADEGPLAGWEVGLKDSVALAGVELTVGSRLFDGVVPSRDATVVTRLLDAGATIRDKLNMEDMAFSGSGELSAHGPVLNPRDPDHLAGGSSGGSAAAVLAGDVDAALGTDQGGSVRIPASWCGIVGHKPTHGLVPYTGIVPLDPAIDHPGPMTRTVEDCARVLGEIAGTDPLDPRQGAVEVEDYAAALDGDPDDVVVGVVEEGFGREESDAAVDEAVRDALAAFEAEGATVRELSVPWHADGPAVLSGITTQGATSMLRADGVGRFARGYYDPALATAFSRARRTNADDLPPRHALRVVLGEYLSAAYGSRFYAIAQNLARELAAAYDDALADVDVLAMPTTPHTAHRVAPEADLETKMERGGSMLGNTSPFDASGHPAVSVPCGSADGLPVGLMFAGGRFDDASVLRAAHAFERSVVDWEGI